MAGHDLSRYRIMASYALILYRSCCGDSGRDRMAAQSVITEAGALDRAGES